MYFRFILKIDFFFLPNSIYVPDFTKAGRSLLRPVVQRGHCRRQGVARISQGYGDQRIASQTLHAIALPGKASSGNDVTNYFTVSPINPYGFTVLQNVIKNCFSVIQNHNLILD